MEIKSVKDELNSLSYHGRGIMIGKSPDGKKAVIAYFIMGRSANSRNRVFTIEGDGIRTQAFDESKMEDPHLIIYSPVRVLNNFTVVTNGDQTDTVYDFIKAGKTFEEGLKTREFEDDAPNYTPRISGIVNIENAKMDFKMSILKSAEGDGSSCQRYTYDYSSPLKGFAKFIHTYMRDGAPLASFEGEPKTLALPDENIDEFAATVWNNLNEQNKVSLFVRYIDIETGDFETRIINKNGD